MDSTTTPTWTRPDDLRPRSRRLLPIAFGSMAIGLSLTTGLLLAEKTSSTAIVPVVAPVHVLLPAATPAPVQVTVTAPEPATATASVGEAVPAPITYRAASPRIAPECVGNITADAADPQCTWDHGFPAISVDGTQIVEHLFPDDGGRGYPGLDIVFTDVATSKVVHKVMVLSPDEISQETGAIDDKLRAKIRRRAAAAQKLIDAKQFRSLVSLGGSSWQGDATASADRSGIHAEFVGQTMRLLDPATKTELWRHVFTASPKFTPNPDKECESWSFANLETWWDPTARVVFGRMIYHHGGCMCGSSSIGQAFRL